MLGPFEPRIDKAPSLTRSAENQIVQLRVLVEIVQRLFILRPNRRLKMAAGTDAQERFDLFMPRALEVPAQIRKHQFFKLFQLYPVAAIDHHVKKMPGKKVDESLQKNDRIPALWIFGVQHADEHIGQSDDFLQKGMKLFALGTVHVRGVHQKYVFQLCGPGTGLNRYLLFSQRIEQQFGIGMAVTEEDDLFGCRAMDAGGRKVVLFGQCI